MKKMGVFLVLFLVLPAWGPVLRAPRRAYYCEVGQLFYRQLPSTVGDQDVYALAGCFGGRGGFGWFG